MANAKGSGARPPKVKRPDLGELLELLTRAVCAAYATDPSAPGILLSHLPQGLWYASLQRYNDTYGGRKWVVAKCTAPTALEAVGGLTRMWLGPQINEERARRELAVLFADCASAAERT